MQPVRGIVLIMIAVALFTVMQAGVKAADTIPAGQAVFFRSFFALPVILAWLVLTRRMRDGLRVKNWKGHATRALVGSTAMGLGFFGLKYIALPEATAIRFATPMLIVVFAAMFLGERFRLIRLAAVSTGMIGVLIVMWPRLTFEAGDLAMLGAMMTLGSAILAALAQIFVKSMVADETTAAIVFYFSLTAATLSLLTIPFGWVWPQGINWVYMIGAGVVGGIGQIILTSAYRYADAGVLAPFTYVAMIYALIIGYFAFGDLPTKSMIFGASLVIAAGIVIALRERALGVKENAKRKIMATKN